MADKNRIRLLLEKGCSEEEIVAVIKVIKNAIKTPSETKISVGAPHHLARLDEDDFQRLGALVESFEAGEEANDFQPGDVRNCFGYARDSALMKKLTEGSESSSAIDEKKDFRD